MSIILRTALLSLILFNVTPARAAAQQPVVHTVLFYSPLCGHCQYYIENDLPVLIDRYGSQLEILYVDITDPSGQALYSSAIERYAIPQERRGVPTMVIGEVVLVGGNEIPERSPGLIDAALASGGLDWPDIPGLEALLAQLQPTTNPTPPSSTPAAAGAPQSTSAAVATPAIPVPTPIAHSAASPVSAMLQDDPPALLLACIVLVLLIAVLPLVWLACRRARRSPKPLASLRYLFPLLAVLGSLVAAYLLFVEASGSLAVCGPIGDCNAVQQSVYTRLFDMVPIAALGLLLQLTLLVLYVLTNLPSPTVARTAVVLLLALSVGGLLFSIYLMALEIFVIGAVCAWCLTSAVIVAGEGLLAGHIAGWRLGAVSAPSTPM